MKRQLHLLVIDPQNDFCDLPEAYLPRDPVGGAPRSPALPVTGAHEDMLRVAELIKVAGEGLGAITVTLDSHHRYDIAHPTFWQRGDGGPVSPFTEILAADVRSGKFTTRDPSALPRALAYIDALQAAGRYNLMVWPVHCEIGSWGHNVHEAVHTAYNRWEDERCGLVAKVVKGSNPWTEHYSAIMAEVPDPDDPATQVNEAFLADLAKADRIYIAGEAGSHCVKATTEHIAERFGSAAMSKLVLLTDCMSPVTGFAAQHDAFISDMRARGAGIATSTDIVPELLANARG
jgi:nicotinamidase-related amidase